MLTVTLVKSKEDRTSCLESKQTLCKLIDIELALYRVIRERVIIIVYTILRLENRGSLFLCFN